MQERGGADSGLVLATDLKGKADLLAFNPRSTRLAISSFGADHVLIVEPHTGRELGRIQKLRSVRALEFLSAEVLLVVQAGVCLRYDLRNRELTPVWQEENKKAANPRYAFGVRASPDGGVVALGTNYGGMLLYDVSRRRVRHSVTTGLAAVPAPEAFSTDGRYVVFRLHAEERSGSILVILDTKTGRRLRTYEVGFAQAVAFQQESLGVIDYDRNATFLYEFTGGEDPVAQFPVGCGAGLRFAEGDRTLELLGQDGSLLRLHRGKSRVLRRASAPAYCEELAHVVPSPDWLFLAVPLENKVVIWRADSAGPAVGATRSR